MGRIPLYRASAPASARGASTIRSQVATSPAAAIAGSGSRSVRMTKRASPRWSRHSESTASAAERSSPSALALSARPARIRAIRSTRLVFETGMARLRQMVRTCNGEAARRFRRSGLLLALLLLAAPAQAQQASPALRGRAEQVVALLRGGGDPAEMFTPAFLAQIPVATLRSVPQQLVAQYGAVGGLDRLGERSAPSGVIDVAFERAIVHIRIVIEPQPPSRIA